MFKLDVLFEDMFLSLNVTSPNQYATLVIEGGSEEKKQLVIDIIRRSHGAFGHLMSEQSMTAIDLDYVANNYLAFEFTTVIVEGAELVEIYDPGIPEGAVT